jgi:hypothetical protein
MKPIRQPELTFFNKIIEDKFYDKRQALAPTMAKQCGVDGDLKRLSEADKKYKAFILSKISTENKLLSDVREQMSKIQSKLEYNDLRDKKSACEIILHTGSDINSTVSTLQKEMSTVNIDLPVPSHLLQLAVK